MKEAGIFIIGDSYSRNVADTKSYLAGPELTQYIRNVSVQEAGVLQRLREETSSHPNAEMQIAPEQAQLFQVLLAVTGAKKTLEVGVFTGYSSLATALALPAEGRVIACDVSDEFTSVAKRWWKEAGVDHKIEFAARTGGRHITNAGRRRPCREFRLRFYRRR